MLTNARAFETSLWQAVSPPAPDMPPVVKRKRVDVAVVGAGFLGLSTALHLAEAGVSVAVLEAKQPGFGASGRNTGFVVPDFLSPLDPEVVRSRLGIEHGDRLCRMLADAGNLVFDLIERHNIACDAVRSGWLQPIHGAGKAATGWLDRRIGLWRALGRDVRAIGVDESRRLTGSPYYHGALMDPTGGHLVPLAFVRGLARAVIDAGGTVHANCPLLEAERYGEGWRLTTPDGVVEADRVVVTTNVTNNGAKPEIEGLQVPIRIIQLATRPLDPALREVFLPEDHCSSDTRRDLIAMRWAPGNRIVTGGVVAMPDSGSDRAVRWFLRRLTTMVPALRDVELEPEFVWHGTAGIAPDLMPMIMEPAPNMLAVVSCNGRGIAMTTGMGREIARFLTSNAQDPSSLPVPMTAPRPLPFPWFARAVKSVILPLARRADYAEGAPI